MIPKMLLATVLICTLTQHAFSQAVRRDEVSIFDVKDDGNGAKRDIVIRGRVFPKSLVANLRNSAEGSLVIPNRSNYDVFEAWIGTSNDADADDTNEFFVLADGEQVYKSPRMSKRDAPIRISVPIKGSSGVTLMVRRPRASIYSANAVWAEPVFVRFVKIAPPAPPYQPASVQDHITVYQDRNGQFAVKVNERPVNFGYVRPQTRGGRVLVPMRKIFEALGATVNFDARTNTILASKNNREVQMRIGSNQAIIDGRTIFLEIPAQTVFGSTLVPLRFVAEAFNVNVDFRR
jgi:hypothetical protein